MGSNKYGTHNEAWPALGIGLGFSTEGIRFACLWCREGVWVTHLHRAQMQDGLLWAIEHERQCPKRPADTAGTDVVESNPDDAMLAMQLLPEPGNRWQNGGRMNAFILDRRQTVQTAPPVAEWEVLAAPSETVPVHALPGSAK
jgi:hypothetical protein